jgi:hypothetical protein
MAASSYERLLVEYFSKDGKWLAELFAATDIDTASDGEVAALQAAMIAGVVRWLLYGEKVN